MFVNGSKRGFSESDLELMSESGFLEKRENGYFYISSVLEQKQVCIDDYYSFLERVAELSVYKLKIVDDKIKLCEFGEFEKKSFFYAQRYIYKLIFNQTELYYTHKADFSYIMSEWCFASIISEKINRFLSDIGEEFLDENIKVGEFPSLFLDYLDEINEATIIDFFNFPKESIDKFWQYTGLINALTRFF